MKNKIILLITILIGNTTIFAQSNGVTWDKRAYLPFEVIDSIANDKLKVWLNRDSEVANFSLERPKPAILPTPKTLTKGEFETTQQFEARVAAAQKQYDSEVARLVKLHQDEKLKYQQALREYELGLDLEKKRRQAASTEKYWQYVYQAFAQELGEPNLKLIKYNADLGVFYAVLTSSKSRFSQWLEVRVPLAHAKSLQNNADQVLPVLYFSKDIKNQLIISSAHVRFGKHKYLAKLIDKPDNLSNTVKATIVSKP